MSLATAALCAAARPVTYLCGEDLEVKIDARLAALQFNVGEESESRSSAERV